MSIIDNLLRQIGITTGAVQEARNEHISKWRRSPGSPEDIWEAHTALTELEEITRRENTSGTGKELEESESWHLANANVAEAMQHVSWLQEWKIRDAVAAGIKAVEPS